MIGLRKCVEKALENNTPAASGASSPSRKKPGITGGEREAHNVGDLAVGMVFAIGLIQKLMQRNKNKSDVLNLSVRIQMQQRRIT